MTNNSLGETTEDLGKKIIKISEELIKCMDNVDKNIDPEQVENVRRMMKECGIVISKKNRELAKMWAKIAEQEQEQESKTEN